MLEVRWRLVAQVAANLGTSAGAVGARLARARARLRVEHVLALRRTRLTTPACRGVLEAVSLGDRRHQRTLGAGAHLLSCLTVLAIRGRGRSRAAGPGRDDAYVIVQERQLHILPGGAR